uniref:Uncharacterized protein LOC100378053 n=1 Tax=Saccoglossus kowalevskii TaxID=10224 RepID=A0ABM0LWK5_SACKO|nr:PREDICTED: uncharacterized protein LOC100378053 [Saccoglossus kowalevskii]
MALVKTGDKTVATATWSTRDKRRTRHKLPGDVEMPVVNYDYINILNNIEGLKDKDNPETSKEAHEKFMQNYRKMFVQANSLCLEPRDKNESESRRSTSAMSTGHVSHFVGATSKKTFVPAEKPAEMSHNIKDHLAKLHKEREEADPTVIQANRIRDLRRILRKLPFERTAAENDTVFNHLKSFPEISEQLLDKELKELSTVTQLEIWKDEEYTVFGNQGLYGILRGSVVPQTRPWLRTKDDKHGSIFRSPTPILTTTSNTKDMKIPELIVGDCFGTLQRIEGREPNSRVLTVITKQVPCEFLKISCSDYKRVTEQIHIRETSEKVDLIQACPSYNLWPRQSLQKLANLIEWLKFQANIGKL